MASLPLSFVAYREGIVNILATKVKIGKDFNPHPSNSPPSLKEYAAIWDTGATNSVITKKVAAECDLKPIGMARMHTAGGERDCPVYFVSIYLPNNAGITQVRVTECDELVGEAEVLIGMDIINLGDFAISNKDGKTVFSFRMPSTGVIDFVKHQALSEKAMANLSGNRANIHVGNREQRRRSKKNH